MAIDFNSGSGHVIGPETFSDQVNAAIDAGILARHAKEIERDYLGASMLGEACGRKLCYYYSKAPKDEDRQFTARTLRIFDIGHDMEDFLGSKDGSQDAVFKAAASCWFHDAGFDLRVKNSQGKQFGWQALGGKMRGHIDGAFVSGPRLKTPVTYPALWEAKALNKKNWSKIKKHGVQVGNEIYYGQCQINMAHLNVGQTIFTAVNKDTEELHHELISFVAMRAQIISDRGLSVIQAVESGHLMDREYNNEDFFKCKLCDWRKRCWKIV